MSWKFLVYDWGGWNVALFHTINSGMPSALDPAAWFFSLIGSYWTAPLVMLGLWAWARLAAESGRAPAIRHQLVRFVLAFGLALVLATALKLLFDFPRPPALYGDLVRVMGTAEWHYSLPSGHSTYAALAAGVLWPLVSARLRVALALYVLLVGWSRIAAGMHFPADVVAGWAIGLGSLALVNRLPLGLATRVDGARPLKAPVWYGLAGAVAMADQAAKSAVALSFAYGEQVRVTPFFNLVHVKNNGAAFSLLASAGGWQRYFLVALALGISVWLMGMLRQGLPRLEAAGYCLFLGGAIGNVVDRMLRGAVIDYLDFHWQGVHWPAFNLADVAISIGAVCLVGAAIRGGALGKRGIAPR